MGQSDNILEEYTEMSYLGLLLSQNIYLGLITFQIYLLSYLKSWEF